LVSLFSGHDFIFIPTYLTDLKSHHHGRALSIHCSNTRALLTKVEFRLSWFTIHAAKDSLTRMPQPQLVAAQQTSLHISRSGLPHVALKLSMPHKTSHHNYEMAAATSSKSIREQRPDLFEFTFIDRHDAKRTVPMEVLSLGFSRTGTACKQITISLAPKPRADITIINSNATRP